MTDQPRRSPMRAAITAFLGLGVLINGIIGFTRRGGGDGGWALDSIWLPVALCVLVINAGTLLEHFRDRRRVER